MENDTLKPTRRLTDEQADLLAFMWLESRDLSALSAPTELVDMYFATLDQINPPLAPRPRPHPKNGRRIISRGV